MNTIISNRTKLKILLILSPFLGLAIIGLCIALPFYPPLGDWIFLCSLLLVLFLASIVIRLYSFRDNTVSLKEFIYTRPLFIKYLLLDRRNETRTHTKVAIRKQVINRVVIGWSQLSLPAKPKKSRGTPCWCVLMRVCEDGCYSSVIQNINTPGTSPALFKIFFYMQDEVLAAAAF